MKILVLSLLRLGDIFMHLHLLEDIKRKYPGSRIDFAINSEFGLSEDLLEGVNKIHLFPRKKLQEELVVIDGSFFRAFGDLENWIRNLNFEKYDLVFDFTHTFLSNKLMDLISANEKRGTVSGYFNDIFSQSARPSFHYVDALRGSLALEKFSRLPKAENRKSKNISIQPLTSDIKKNWGLQKYKTAIEILSQKLPSYQFSIIGAPFEEAILRENFQETDKIKIEILNLKELYFHLWETELLISGDTATVHLASHCRTPMFNLYIGSADPFKTTPYIQGAYIAHSEEICAPCSHSANCHQPSQLCAETISAEDICCLIQMVVSDNKIGLEEAANKSVFNLYETQENFSGNLLLKDLSSNSQTLKQKVRQLSWLIKQNNEHFSYINELLPKGNEKISDLAWSIKEELNVLQWSHQVFIEIEKWTQQFSRYLLQSNIDFENQDDRILEFKSLLSEWTRVTVDSELQKLLMEFGVLIGQDNPFIFYKKLRWALSQVGEILFFQKKIYENLSVQLQERGFFYVTGSGKLS